MGHPPGHGARNISLGGGRVVPYPEPSSSAASQIGRANRRVDTSAEVRLRRQLHSIGLRFRKDLLVRLDGLRTHIDVAFTRPQVAVFVDGCFWHGCPEHGTMPKANPGYWGPKLARNAERDRQVTTALSAAGWTVIRVWEHEVLEPATSRILRELVYLGHPPALRAATVARTDPQP